MYSQNNEEQIVAEYFGGMVGTLIDIGANDGITFSNSYHLIKNLGWQGILLEPSKSGFERLIKTYDGIKNIPLMINAGISTETGELEFLESGAYDRKGEEVALLSTLVPSETLRWEEKVDFEKTKAKFYTWRDFNIEHNTKYWYPDGFNFITIDAEGMDLAILHQIDLDEVNCRCFCIEHNGIQALIDDYHAYASKYGMVQIGFNGENLIFAKPKN